MTIGATEALSATLTAILEPGEMILPATTVIQDMSRSNLVALKLSKLDTTATRFALTPTKGNFGAGRYSQFC